MTDEKIKEQILDFIYRSGLSDLGSLAEAQELRKFLNSEIEKMEKHLEQAYAEWETE